MSKLIEFLSDHEYHSGELLTKHRDHYSHSVYVFALGLAIYSNDKKYRKIFTDFYKNINITDYEFLHLWGLTALFHDIGYPFQLAYDQIKSYTEGLWGKDNTNNPYVSYQNMNWLITLDDTSKKHCFFNSLRTVGEVLSYGINYRLEYPLHILLKLLNKRYENQPNFMDHGYFSALLLARRLIDSKESLTIEMIDVLTAIALHNSLNAYDIKAEFKANDIDIPTKISPYKHPLAYLLILCDELQNWDRTPFGYISKKDPLAWAVELDISDTNLTMNYIFDTFKICIEKYEDNINDNGFKSIDSKVVVHERINNNVINLQKNDFEQKIYSLVDCYQNFTANAIEQKKERKTAKSFVSSDKFINLCDFAMAIHSSYQLLFGGPDFDELPLEFKLSNIEQAKSYSDKLELINCFYSDKELDYPIITGFTSRNLGSSSTGKRDDLGFLAREEHLRWVKEKLNSGWKYGTDYKNTTERNLKKIHKDIIPYDCLDDETKAKDELMIRNMVPFLYEYGHGVRIYSYTSGRKPVLNIFGCGHRTISNNKENLKKEIKQILTEYQKKYRVVVRTSFAFGADQLIAQCAIELGITIKGAIPFELEEYIKNIKEDSKKYNYRFDANDELNMRHLLAQTVSLKVIPDEKYTYLEASKYILNKCEKMIVLWDGIQTILEDSNGHPINWGGTWHNIYLAKNSRGLKDEDIHIIKCDR